MKSAPPYKIGFVLDGGLEQPDGVQQYILTLGSYFKSLGHQVRYLVAGPIAPGIDDAVSLSRNLHVTSNGNRLAIPLPAKKDDLRKFMHAEAFDVLHVQTPYSPLMGGKLISLATKRMAVIGTFHVLPNAWYFSLGNRLLGLWCHFTLKRFDKMVSVSSAAQAFCKKTFKINTDVLPNVIDYDRFHEAKVRPEYDDRKLTILFFGRLVPRKGCGLLLEAVKQLVDSGMSLPEYRVVICGTGPLEPSLKKYVKKHSLENVVEFKGYINESDKPSYYASADIAVFPSVGGESFGIVLLEAMSSGNAVVLAGNNPGYGSVMSPKPELLFDPHDAKALAQKLSIHLNDHVGRQGLSEWCGEYAMGFDVKIIGTRLINLYREALHNRRSA